MGDADLDVEKTETQIHYFFFNSHTLKFIYTPVKKRFIFTLFLRIILFRFFFTTLLIL